MSKHWHTFDFCHQFEEKRRGMNFLLIKVVVCSSLQMTNLISFFAKQFIIH